MEKNQFLVLRNIFEKGYRSIREISKDINLSIGSISSILNELKRLRFIDINGVTDIGLSKLEEYKVKTAIIMAAGPSTRLAPLSFDTPKGLFEVKGEILLERQIKQLLEVGINNIVLVLGYKKESFFYLTEKYNLKIIINPSYNIKNNCETLFLARQHFSNAYICSCDQYFTVNPFHEYEYETFYTAVNTDIKENEPYIIKGHNDIIVRQESGKKEGLILLGFSYWNDEFAEAFKTLLENHHDIGDFDNMFWESAFLDNINRLPKMHVSVRNKDTIFEFDNLDQLRKFDEKYIHNTSSKILKNISKVLNCNEGDIYEFKPIKEGMTNTSYTFKVNDKTYVYRHPGDGTEKIIKRNSEKNSLLLAKKLGIDPTFIEMSDKEGWKISSYIYNVRYPDYHNFEDSKLIIKKLKELHNHKAKVDWCFKPWEDALEMENIVRKGQGIEMPDFDELKANIKILFDYVDNDGLVEKCFCHCDTYQPNWLINDKNEVVLIDWEYAGYSDPGVDVGYYIVDAMYDFDDAKRFVKEYLGKDYTFGLEKHYMSYIAIIGYYWFVWALFRENCGAVMGEALYNWYYMAKKYSTYVLENYYGNIK